MHGSVVRIGHTFDGSEPAGTYLTCAALIAAGGNPLDPTKQLSVDMRSFAFAP